MLDSILGETKAKGGEYCKCNVAVEILLVGFNFFNGEDFFIVSPLPEVYIII